MNPNTEEQIVQAMVGVLAYNLAENDENIKFDYRVAAIIENNNRTHLQKPVGLQCY